MRILYLSCHEILEHDEIKLFAELGHYVFSPGAYVEPANQGNLNLRPALPQIQYDQGDIDAYNAIKAPPGIDRKYVLTRDFVKRFDVVVNMHIPRWITNNWLACLGKPVVWRTIGQSISHNEAELRPFRDKGLNIVRYSPAERSIPGYIGEDAMIRFYKDPEEFKGWEGSIPKVLTVNQHIKQRGQACNYGLYETVTSQLPRTLMGPGNEGLVGSVGRGTFEDLKLAMQHHRCYFYVGTHPASYTLNFMEAWMTGIPIVAIGERSGNASYFPNHKLYEVPDLIQNGVNGFVSDDPAELQSYCRALLNNDSLAKRIGAAGRESAVKHFGKAEIASQWKAYLETL